MRENTIKKNPVDTRYDVSRDFVVIEGEGRGPSGRAVFARAVALILAGLLSPLFLDGDITLCLMIVPTGVYFIYNYFC